MSIEEKGGDFDVFSPLLVLGVVSILVVKVDSLAEVDETRVVVWTL